MDRRRVVALALMGTLVAGFGLAGRAEAATESVTVDDYTYSPGELRIAPGDRVEWTNDASQGHTVTSDAPFEENFDSGRMSEDEEYSHTFHEPGTYAYHCEIHDSMHGVVYVGEPAAPTTATTAAPTTTTTAPPPTTTTTASRPAATTTTTAPPTIATTPPRPTTTTTGRTPAAAVTTTTTTPKANVPTTTTTAAAPTTTTAPPESSTTTVPGESTTTTLPGPPPGDDVRLGPEPPPVPPGEPDGEGDLIGEAAFARGDGGGSGTNPLAVTGLVAVVLGAGAFGGWTLWKLRPVRS